MTWAELLLAAMAGAAGGLCAWFGVRARSKRQLQEWLQEIVKDINSKEGSK